MAINVVTGVGPRVGSSFVMQQCKKAGLYVNGDKFMDGFLPEEGNPEGYYDLNPYDVTNVSKGVAKVWPGSLQYLQEQPSKMVILRRKDRHAQIQSCYKQIEREPVDLGIPCDTLIEYSGTLLTDWLSLNKNVIAKVFYRKSE